MIKYRGKIINMFNRDGSLKEKSDLKKEKDIIRSRQNRAKLSKKEKKIVAQKQRDKYHRNKHKCIKKYSDLSTKTKRGLKDRLKKWQKTEVGKVKMKESRGRYYERVMKGVIPTPKSMRGGETYVPRSMMTKEELNKCRVRDSLYRKKNKDVIKRSKEKYAKKIKKIAYMSRQIKSFFISKKWPYSSKGKNQALEQMTEVIKDYTQGKQSTFLSMPNTGRELQHFKDEGLLYLPDSVGVERDKKLFNTFMYYIMKRFKGFTMEKADINEYIAQMKKQFDYAHLDYNGPLVESHIQPINKLIDQNTLTFVTINMHNRFDHIRKDVELITDSNKLVFESDYLGLRNIPMKTLGIIK